MRIHTVKEGECLYTIARKYDIPVTKLLADNDLCTDRLTVGDELLIMTPSRTVTVRGGDTIDSLSGRFSVRDRDILTLNPALMGRKKLRPGQILTVKQSNSHIGAGSSVAFIDKGSSYENIIRYIPFATYFVINAAVIDDGKVELIFNPKRKNDTVNESKKISILGIKDLTDGDFLKDSKVQEEVIDSAINIAKEFGFSGISISSEGGGASLPDEFCAFLMLCRKKLIGCDMILFTEIFPSTPSDASEISDGAVLYVDNSSVKSAKDGMRLFSDAAESSKVFVKLNSSLKIGEGQISISEAKDLCYRSGSRLISDKETLLSHFEYTRYKNGQSEKIQVSFPSLEFTKAKLETLGELGFMGIGFDAETTPVTNLVLFGYLFARADYLVP